MENCIFKGKMICTYDLKDETGIYYEDMVLEWKEAASDRDLHCVDCGAPVYLAAGPIKEPYFAHYDLAECEYGSRRESEELKKGKRLLYHLLKRSFPDSNIQARYRLENGMYSTLFCNYSSQSIVMDYRLVNHSLQKFRMRNDYYLMHQIKAVYILGKRQNKDTKQLDWYQNLIQSIMGYLAFLDTEKEQIILKRSFGYRLGKERHFKYCVKAYSVRELAVDTEGRMLCDFDTLCYEVERQVEADKSKYDREQEHIRKLREEKIRLEQEEQIRMEAYRRLQESSLKGSNYVEQDEEAHMATERPALTLNKHSNEEILAFGLNINLYHKCLAMIEQGDGHLVAKKYYELITGVK